MSQFLTIAEDRWYIHEWVENFQTFLILKLVIGNVFRQDQK